MQIRTDVRIYSGIFFAILAALGVIIYFRASSPPPPKVATFEQCAAAGYPVIESLPRQCRTPLGKSFFETFDESKIHQNAGQK